MSRPELPTEDREYVMELVRRVSAHLHLNPLEVVAKGNKAGGLPLARQIIWHHLYLRESWPYARIGKHFDGRDHSTIAHGLSRIQDVLDIPGSDGREVRELMATLPTREQWVLGNAGNMTQAALLHQVADGLEMAAAAYRALATQTKNAAAAEATAGRMSA